MKWYERLFKSSEGRRGILAGILIALGVASPAAFVISDSVNSGVDAVIESKETPAPGEAPAPEPVN